MKGTGDCVYYLCMTYPRIGKTPELFSSEGQFPVLASQGGESDVAVAAFF
jgi:hypothetical protein